MFVGDRRSEMTSTMVDYSSCDSPYRSVEWQGDEYSPNLADTMRSLKVDIKSCKAYNNMLIESPERLARN